MDAQKQKLLIEQVDRKLSQLRAIKEVVAPQKGWIFAIRKALKMSLRQLGDRLNISAQGIKDIEMRETNGSITIKALKEVAQALDMEFVYCIIPKEASIEVIIEKRAKELAKKIVMRTSNTMKLEDQENSPIRLEKAIASMADEIKNTMPKYLWD